MRLAVVAIMIASFIYANSLQEAINLAQSGDTISLGRGEFRGNILINKPLTIKGDNRHSVIVGDENASVIKITSPNVTIKGVKITKSGNLHTTIDAGISCEGAYNVVIEDNSFEDTLFGIDFKQCNASTIKNNLITSKNLPLGLRGDAIRLWYSHDNEISNNQIYKSRDMVIWYSSRNLIKSNYAREGRYSLHFMYAGKNLVEDNLFEQNSVGIFFMFSSGSTVKRNTVLSSTGAFGVGIGMKDTSDFWIEGNTLMYNARGIYIDQSPFQPGTTNSYIKNQILYNSTGVAFHATQHPSIFEDNDFLGNIEILINDTPGEGMSKNIWRKNYYDDYEGFDKNKDGFGDLEYKNFAYADTLWHYRPGVKFFYASTALGAINFLAKLAPFSEPTLLIIDTRPRMRPYNNISIAKKKGI